MYSRPRIQKPGIYLFIVEIGLSIIFFFKYLLYVEVFSLLYHQKCRVGVALKNKLHVLAPEEGYQE